MIDFFAIASVAIASRQARICFGGRQNESIPRVAAVCAVAIMAAIAGVVGGGWAGAAYADGGADARKQAAYESGARMLQDYTLGIARALADDDGDKWVRYWRARADCEAAAYAPDGEGAALIDRFLMRLADRLCARLEVRLGVNPGDYPPRGEERTVGLLLNEPESAMGYTLFTSGSNSDIFLLDPLGRVAHAWHLDSPFNLNHAKLLDNGNLLANISYLDSVAEIDPPGNIVWEYRMSRLHHDFLKMPNGNIMLLVEGRKTREEAIAAGANPEFVRESGLLYDYLLEVRPTGASGGEVVWEWSVWEHLVQDFDPSKPNYGAVAEHPELIDINFLLESINSRTPDDWMHTNGIDYNPELDQIMLSPRNFSELWIIDHSADTEEARGRSGGNGGIGGGLLYRWGNPRAYGRGDADDQRLFWQHQTHWIPPGLPGAGNILVFNNGNEFRDYRRYYSSIDEIAPPVDGYGYRRAEGSAYPPDEPEWTYVAETPPDFYAPVVSGTQRLPNGNTLIVDGTAGTIFQATHDGRIVWKYVAPLDRRAHLRQGETPSLRQTFPNPYGDRVPHFTNSVYRAYWYPANHPGLQALDLTPSGYIEDSPDIYDRAYAAGAAALAGDFGDPIARSGFDIYLDKDDKDGGEDNRRLIYVKQPCTDEDAQARFFLHIIPVDARDLPAHRQEHNFDNLDFNFGADEVRASDGRCAAARDLPGYPIERIRTGQFTDTGVAWRAEVELGD